MNGRQQLRRCLRQKLQSLDGLPLKVEEARFDFRRAQTRLRDARNLRGQERPAAQELLHLKALIALADKMVAAIRRSDIAHDIGHGADAVHVGRIGIGDLGVALHEDADLTLFPHCLLCGSDRARPTDRDR